MGRRVEERGKGWVEYLIELGCKRLRPSELGVNLVLAFWGAWRSG